MHLPLQPAPASSLAEIALASRTRQAYKTLCCLAWRGAVAIWSCACGVRPVRLISPVRQRRLVNIVVGNWFVKLPWNPSTSNNS
jgi:hypothetical protein